MPLISSAQTFTFSSSGAAVEATALISNNCSNLSVDLIVSEDSSRTQAIKLNNPGAFFTFSMFDFCLNQFSFGFGSTVTGLDFKKTGNTITVSGSVPIFVEVIDFNNFQVIRNDPSVVNFTNLVFTQTSNVIDNVSRIEHHDQVFGASSIKTFENRDLSTSTAKVSGNILSPIDGSVVNLSIGTIGVSKNHSISITK